MKIRPVFFLFFLVTCLFSMRINASPLNKPQTTIKTKSYSQYSIKTFDSPKYSTDFAKESSISKAWGFDIEIPSYSFMNIGIEGGIDYLKGEKGVGLVPKLYYAAFLGFFSRFQYIPPIFSEKSSIFLRTGFLYKPSLTLDIPNSEKAKDNTSGANIEVGFALSSGVEFYFSEWWGMTIGWESFFGLGKNFLQETKNDVGEQFSLAKKNSYFSAKNQSIFIGVKTTYF